MKSLAYGTRFIALALFSVLFCSSVAAATPYLPGDANQDCRFDSTDLVDIFTWNTYETDTFSSWAQGDFNGDARSDSSDLVSAFNTGMYEYPANYCTTCPLDDAKLIGFCQELTTASSVEAFSNCFTVLSHGISSCQAKGTLPQLCTYVSDAFSKATQKSPLNMELVNQGTNLTFLCLGAVLGG